MTEKEGLEQLIRVEIARELMGAWTAQRQLARLCWVPEYLESERQRSEGRKQSNPSKYRSKNDTKQRKSSLGTPRNEGSKERPLEIDEEEGNETELPHRKRMREHSHHETRLDDTRHKDSEKVARARDLGHSKRVKKGHSLSQATAGHAGQPLHPPAAGPYPPPYPYSRGYGEGAPYRAALNGERQAPAYPQRPLPPPPPHYRMAPYGYPPPPPPPPGVHYQYDRHYAQHWKGGESQEGPREDHRRRPSHLETSRSKAPPRRRDS